MITFRDIPNKVVNNCTNYPHNQIVHEYYYLQDVVKEPTMTVINKRC